MKNLAILGRQRCLKLSIVGFHKVFPTIPEESLMSVGVSHALQNNREESKVWKLFKTSNIDFHITTK